MTRTTVFRFAFLRSDLSCHHIRINLSNQLLELRSAASGYAGLTLM